MRKSHRAGVTLTEVLIATFVMAVGLLSLASLIPVGMHEIAIANRSQRGAHTGRAAWRLVKIRDMLRPVRADGSPNWLSVTGTSLISPPPSSFALDPLFVAAANAAGVNADLFPFPSDPLVVAPRLTRITLDPNQADGAALLAPAQDLMFNRRLFTDDSDPEFVKNPGQFRSERVEGAANYPQIAGEYSWMLMVNPSSGDLGRMSTVSVAVFYKRFFPVLGVAAVSADNRRRERSANVTFLSTGAGIALGGGDIRIDWPVAELEEIPRIKPNQWIMLYGVNTSTLPNAVEARWYRVVAADEFNPANGSVRFLTIQGPDWNTGMIPATYAGIFESVVGVYEKTIQLE